jgi:hypothetical protein
MFEKGAEMKKFLVLLFLLLIACKTVSVEVFPASPTKAIAPTPLAVPVITANPPQAAGLPSPTSPPTQAPPTALPTATQPAPPPSATQAVEIAAVTATPSAPPAPTLTADEQAVKALADQAILALKNKDMAALAALIDPAKGVRFSPYANIQEKDRRYMPNTITRAFADPEKYLWGHFDGSGLPIDYNFKQYYDKFVYDKDFSSAPSISVDQSLAQGNIIDNLAEFYPGAIFVEYYFPGFDPQYQGMDWEALRLAFQQDQGKWRLVGIIHDQWTT